MVTIMHHTVSSITIPYQGIHFRKLYVWLSKPSLLRLNFLITLTYPIFHPILNSAYLIFIPFPSHAHFCFHVGSVFKFRAEMSDRPHEAGRGVVYFLLLGLPRRAHNFHPSNMHRQWFNKRSQVSCVYGGGGGGGSVVFRGHRSFFLAHDVDEM